MQVAVITPYFRTPAEWLKRCHDAVRVQQHPCTHILVADGEPQDAVRGFAAQHIVLPVTHRDYGDTARAIGALSAIAQGFDAITYLDADNWYTRGHIASLVALHHETGAAICTASRILHHLDGRQMGFFVDEQFCDTNCRMLLRPAFGFAADWALLDPDEHPIGDFVTWQRIVESGLPRAASGRHTMVYTGTHAGLYDMLDWPIPEAGASSLAISQAKAKWAARGKPPYPQFNLAANAHHQCERGDAWASLGQWGKALAAYEKALELTSDCDAAHDGRRRALAALGGGAEARASD